MAKTYIERDSDRTTLAIEEQEAEQADLTNRARRIIPVNSSGNSNSSDNPIFTQDTPYYKHIIDTPNASTQYNGYADPGTMTTESSWLITKQTMSGNTVTIEFADGDKNFDNKWSDRTSLSYS